MEIVEALEKNHSNLHQLVSFAVQLSVLIVFQELNLKISVVYGDGLGKLVAAFHYQLVTLEEAVLRALTIIKQKKSKKWSSVLDKINDLQVPVSLENKIVSQIDSKKVRDDSFIKQEWTKTIQKSIAINVSDLSLNVNDWKLTDLNSLLEILGR